MIAVGDRVVLLQNFNATCGTVSAVGVGTIEMTGCFDTFGDLPGTRRAPTWAVRMLPFAPRKLSSIEALTDYPPP